MNKINVAVFPAGSEIGLEIHNALRFVKDITLYGFTSTSDHSSLVYKNMVSGLPYLGCDNLFDAMEKEIKRLNIHYIFPAHDDATVFLSANAERLSAKIVSPDESACNICRSKTKTFKALEGCSFVPEVYDPNNLGKNDFPVFIKPDRGQGSVGAKKITSRELLSKVCSIDEYVVCEYLPGKEYTVDCLTDINGKVLVSRHRERKRVKAGISVASGCLTESEIVRSIAKKVSEKIGMKGAWFFQVKENGNGDLILMEVAARIAGTMGMYRNLGINFPLLSLYISRGIDVHLIENMFDLGVDRAFINRYHSDLEYETVYIDFDDTVIHGEEVNVFIMQFIYQCQNKHVDICLITRHADDITDTLENMKIHADLFKKIIHLKEGEKKSDYITEKSAIFIDDSFSERMDVFSRCSVPVFDLDSIELLLDWRR